MKYRIAAALLGFTLLLIWGCSGGEVAPKKAKATLINPQGQKVGEAKLAETPNGVKIVMTVENLPPGVHAFHIHEKGLCTPPDFKSAGGHFNPFGKKHGLKNPQGPHAGDLPNLVVGTDGKETVEIVASLVIHQGPDDYLSDPAGNAGPRIACGVITK